MKQQCLYEKFLGMAKADFLTMAGQAVDEQDLSFRMMCEDLDKIPLPPSREATFNTMCDQIDTLMAAPKRGNYRVVKKKKPVVYTF